MLVSLKSSLGGRKKIWTFCFPRHLSGMNLTCLQFSLQREFAPQSLALVQKTVASDLAAAYLPCRVWDNVGRCWMLQIQGFIPKQGVLLQPLWALGGDTMKSPMNPKYLHGRGQRSKTICPNDSAVPSGYDFQSWPILNLYLRASCPIFNFLPSMLFQTTQDTGSWPDWLSVPHLPRCAPDVCLLAHPPLPTTQVFHRSAGGKTVQRWATGRSAVWMVAGLCCPCDLGLDDCRIARSRIPSVNAGVQGRWQAVGCRSERQRSYPSNRPLSWSGFPQHRKQYLTNWVSTILWPFQRGDHRW